MRDKMEEVNYKMGMYVENEEERLITYQGGVRIASVLWFRR